MTAGMSPDRSPGPGPAAAGLRQQVTQTPGGDPRENAVFGRLDDHLLAGSGFDHRTRGALVNRSGQGGDEVGQVDIEIIGQGGLGAKEVADNPKI